MDQSSPQGKSVTDSTNENDTKTSRTWFSYLIIAVISLLVGGGSYAGYFYFKQRTGKDSSQQSRPPATVTAALAKQQSWTSELTGVGTVTSVQGTELTSESAGKVTGITFKSGQHATQGDVLVQLDTSSEIAQLETLQPQLRQAKSDRDRAKQLIESNAISAKAYEESFAEVDRLQAAINQQSAIINRKQIKAPFTGELGIRRVNLGQYIAPGTSVVSLQQIAPIFVDFDLPEQNAGQVQEGQVVRVRTAAFPDDTFDGEITAITPLVQQATRSFTVRAELTNESGRLRPGMFADVTVELPQARSVITVPQTAIAFNAYGRSVFVIKDEVKSRQTIAKRKFVKTGERRGLEIEITQGIEPSERVVTAGQLKLSDGMAVKIATEDTMEGIEERPIKP